MNFRTKAYCAGTCLALCLLACSGQDANTPTPGSSNSTSAGGAKSAGGTSSKVAGGTSSNASGGTSAASGGSTTAVSSGGTSASSSPASSTANGGSDTNSSGGASSKPSSSSAPKATGGTSSPATGGAGTKAAGGTSSVSGGGAGTKPTTPGGAPSAGGTQAVTAAGSTSTSTGGGNAGGAPAAAGSSGTATGQHWLGTWTASPYVDSNSNNTPPITLSNSVIRQVVHISLGGKQFRVQFSNLWGNGALAINGAHIALCKNTTTADSTIDKATDKPLTFSGKENVSIAQGQEVWSDPIDMTIPNLTNVTITTSFGSVPSTITQHSGSRTTSYFKSGGTTADLSADNMSSATTKVLWFFISGMEVMADGAARGVVAIGDSITDGRGTDNDKNNRWTDILASRLLANEATSNVSMMNQAIGATNVAGNDKTTGQSRFARDVLGQSGVKYVIVLYGVNDIGSSNSTFDTIKGAYDDMIKKAHDKKLVIYGGTILPFGGNTGSPTYDTPAHEEVRKQVNEYIKKDGVFDGYIDFDAALRDPAKPTALLETYADWSQKDWLHPGPAGYKKMGETPDLTLFTK